MEVYDTCSMEAENCNRSISATAFSGSIGSRCLAFLNCARDMMASCRRQT